MFQLMLDVQDLLIAELVKIVVDVNIVITEVRAVCVLKGIQEKNKKENY
mgnify:CR=1 FL=1